MHCKKSFKLRKFPRRGQGQAVLEYRHLSNLPTNPYQLRSYHLCHIHRSETKYTTGNFNDCTHWYKALAYLKAGDKESALKELNDLLEHGENDNLVELATDLLNKLPK